MSSVLSRAAARRTSNEGSQFFYCYLCGFDHWSEHQHTAAPALLSAMRSAWPTESKRLGELEGRKSLIFCCSWLTPGHKRRVRDVESWLAESPPNRKEQQTTIRATWANVAAARANADDDEEELHPAKEDPDAIVVTEVKSSAEACVH
jgi:alkylhydroperoxidase family enzyme